MARLASIRQYPTLWFTLPGRIPSLREQGDVRAWVEFAYDSPFRPEQVRSEIVTFIEHVAARRPQTVVEIGTRIGGTLLLLTLAAAPDATIISVDMPTGRFGGYAPWKGSCYI
jgi:predicted O-methyltransferase YrrM